MIKETKIKIENRLIVGKRILKVYHHDTQSVYTVSNNNSITLFFKTFLDDDYIYISQVKGPVPTEFPYIITMPRWIDFEVISSIGHFSVNHRGESVDLKIPPSIHTWKIKLTHSSAFTQRVLELISVSDMIEEKND